jgi:predicted lipoprotein with Yx(FWY)xxD motif
MRPLGGRTAPRDRWRRLAMAVLPSLVVAAALSSCGGGASVSPSSSRNEVRSATIPGLGRVLIDGAGYTLYAYMPDHQRLSHCLGSCARQWPPLVLGATQKRVVAGPGVRAALLGTVRRPDGDLQVTYDGWPLYTTANTTPGHANGQASTMGAWSTVSTSGTVDRGVVSRVGA